MTDAGEYKTGDGPRFITTNIAQGLHAEVLDRSVHAYAGQTYTTETIATAHSVGAKDTAQTAYTYILGNLPALQTYYSSLPPSQKWKFLNGTTVTDPMQAAMVDINGSPVINCDGSDCVFVNMSTLNAYWISYLTDMMKLGIAAGSDGFYLDSMTPDYFDRGGFDVWSTNAFRLYLASTFTPQQLASMGITDLNTFNHAVYFKTKGYTSSNHDWPNDPIWRAYTKFEITSYLNNVKTIRDAVKSTGATLSFHGNAANDPLSPWVPMLLPYQDVIHIEDGYEYFYNVFGYADPGPMQSWLKTYYSYTLGNKPSWIMGDLPTTATLTQASEDLLKFYVAETYSSGDIFEVPYTLKNCPQTGSCYNEFLGDAKHAARLAAAENYATFIQSHRNLFGESINLNSKVALIHSMPTMLWNFGGADFYWGYNNGNFYQALEGYALALEANHIPYDVLTFGHAQFLDDTPSLTRLKNYDVVVLPNVEDISRADLAALQSYVQSGGTLVIVGVRPTFDEDHTPLSASDNSWLLGQGQRSYGSGTIVSLSSSVDINNNEASWYFQAVIQGRTNLLSNLTPLVNAVNVGYMPDVQLSAPSSVVVDTFSHPGNRILHLLNYGYQNGPVSNIQVSWKLPAGVVPGLLMLESPDMSSDVPLNYAVNSGWLQFTVPSLSIWNMIVLNFQSAQISFFTNPVSSGSISWDSCSNPGYTNGQTLLSSSFGVHVICYVPSGYTFSSWTCTGDLACSGSSNPNVATFSGPGTITLNFKTGSLTNPISTSLTASASFELPCSELFHCSFEDCNPFL